MDKRVCSILSHRKDLHIENFVENILVVVDVVVVDIVEIDVVEIDFVEVDVVMVSLVEVGGVQEDAIEEVDEDYLMNDIVCFGTYHQLDLDCRS